MARINNKSKYPFDPIVTLDDFLVGTNGGSLRKETRNYPISSLIKLLEEIGGVSTNTFKVVLDPNLNKTPSTGDLIVSDLAFINNTQVKVSKSNTSGVDVSTYLGFILNNKEFFSLKIIRSGDYNVGAFAEVIEFTEESDHYIVDLKILEGNAYGELIEGSLFTIDISPKLSIFRNTQPPPVTIGGYIAGEPATPEDGLTVEESFNKLLFPPLPPNVSFTTSGQAIFNEPSPDVELNWSIDIRTVNATLSTIEVEFKRSGSSVWSSLYSYDSETDGTSFDTSFTQVNSGNSSNEDYQYRIIVEDSSGSSSTINRTITTREVSFFGVSEQSSWTPSIVDEAGISRVLTTSRSNTFTGVDPDSNDFTYFIYPSSYGDISKIFLDGVEPILGAFTKIEPSTSVTNDFGESDNYNVYKSNSTNAFDSVTLIFE